jgi:hypothetical protein
MLRLSVAQLYQSAIELAPIDSHPAVPDQESLRTQSQMLNAVNDLVTWCKAIKDDPSGDGTLDERAASAKFAHPEWTDQQIADHVKCGRGALFKPHMKAYKAAKAALKARRYDYRHNR